MIPVPIVLAKSVLNERFLRRSARQQRLDLRTGLVERHVNRVQFSMGRDLRLNPAQDGKPLNYFVYPYVEVDGQEYNNVSLAFSFAEAGTSVAEK